MNGLLRRAGAALVTLGLVASLFVGSLAPASAQVIYPGSSSVNIGDILGTVLTTLPALLNRNNNPYGYGYPYGYSYPYGYPSTYAYPNSYYYPRTYTYPNTYYYPNTYTYPNTYYPNTYYYPYRY